MGAIGSDTAIETADVALMEDDLGKLASAIYLGKRIPRDDPFQHRLRAAGEGGFPDPVNNRPREWTLSGGVLKTASPMKKTRDLKDSSGRSRNAIRARTWSLL